MGRPTQNKEEMDSFDRAMKRLDMDIQSIHVNYQEYGHALTNKLLEAAIQHLVHRIDPDFFEGVGYLHYKINDYYVSEAHQKENMLKQ